MFTGIIEEIGTVEAVHTGGDRCSIVISAHTVTDGTNIGDSISVNGVCLTVTSLDAMTFTADVMPETLRRSNLGTLHYGSKVNLERALLPTTRLGGHIVSGHIDGMGTVRSMQKEKNAVWLTVSADKAILSLIVEKGSVAIDGVSLTVAEVTDTTFSVSLIPHTGEVTTLLSKRVGENVNLENDVIGKYVQKFIEKENQSGITMEFLMENGF